jgi:hypothetical protein
MSNITKISSEAVKTKIIQDKTDWQKVYRQPQTQVDSEAQKDQENPIIKIGKIRRLHDRF